MQPTSVRRAEPSLSQEQERGEVKTAPLIRPDGRDGDSCPVRLHVDGACIFVRANVSTRIGRRYSRRVDKAQCLRFDQAIVLT